MDLAPTKVSIGMPVYNGEALISETLESILSQTLEDFELIISDNASTDRTEEICRAYALADKRIRYYRNSENLGMARNFNKVFELSKSQYFQWTSHDDLYAHDYLEKCVGVLDDYPSVILCHSKARIIDSNGQGLFNEDYQLRTASSKKWQRFHDLICASHHQHRALEQFGLIRVDTLKKTTLMSYCAHADRLLLAQLSLLGKFYCIPETLFFYRDHAIQSVKTPTNKSYLGGKKIFTFSGPKPPTEVWDPEKKGMIDFPEWRAFYKYFQIIQAASLDTKEAFLCHLSLIMRFFAHNNWARLIRDLLMAFEQKLFFNTESNKPHSNIPRISP